MGIANLRQVSSVGNEYLFPPTATHPTASTNPVFLDLIKSITREQVDSPDFLPVRCPNKEAASRMYVHCPLSLIQCRGSFSILVWEAIGVGIAK